MPVRSTSPLKLSNRPTGFLSQPHIGQHLRLMYADDSFDALDLNDDTVLHHEIRADVRRSDALCNRSVPLLPGEGEVFLR